VIKHNEGTKPNGSVDYRYELTPEEFADGWYYGFIPGPVAGTLVVNGTEYDCTPDHIAVKRGDADELAWSIQKFHHAEGRFLETPLPGDGSLQAFAAAVTRNRPAPEGDTDSPVE
jgi:hypothetical protein